MGSIFIEIFHSAAMINLRLSLGIRQVLNPPNNRDTIWKQLAGQQSVSWDKRLLPVRMPSPSGGLRRSQSQEPLPVRH